MARIPSFGISFTEHAERERDVFLTMYIAGGSMLPLNAEVNDLSMSFARRIRKKTFASPGPAGPINSPASRDTPVPAGFLIRILYWSPPVSLAAFLLGLLGPKTMADEV